MRVAEAGIAQLHEAVDTLIIIPNQNLFLCCQREARPSPTHSQWRDRVICSGISYITDLMVKEGLVNLDFADVCSIMSEMGSAMIGTGEAMGARRAHHAAEAAIANPLSRGCLAERSPGRSDFDHRRQGSHVVRKRTRPRAGYARKSTRKPTSSSARSSNLLSSKRCGCRSSRRASISRPIVLCTLSPLPSRSPPRNAAPLSLDQTARPPSFPRIRAASTCSSRAESSRLRLFQRQSSAFPEPTGRRQNSYERDAHRSAKAIQRLLERSAGAAAERRQAWKSIGLN